MTDVFDRDVATYDAWYDTDAGRAVFRDECAAVQPLLAALPRPWLEIGTGTGRFAANFGVEFGIDPSLPSLAIARRRQVRVVAARGEALPFPAQTFGAVLIVATLCFVADPLAVLREARRVIQPQGGIVLGIIPGDGPWGQHYQKLAAEGHAYYRRAHFFRRPELGALLRPVGLQAKRTRSALGWAPHDHAPPTGTVTEGDDRLAGFLAVLATPS